MQPLTVDTIQVHYLLQGQQIKQEAAVAALQAVVGGVAVEVTRAHGQAEARAGQAVAGAGITADSSALAAAGMGISGLECVGCG
jgi:hypothetical protein